MPAALRARLAEIEVMDRSKVALGHAGSASPGRIVCLVVLIAMLASAPLTEIEKATPGNREAILREDLFRMRDAIEQFRSDKNRYPSALSELVSEGYLRALPHDPMTHSADSWRTIPAPAAPGVMNVKSGSGAVANDGSRYADWE